MVVPNYSLKDFDFDLPQELIAQAPPTLRSESRLLEVGNPLKDYRFADLLQLLKPTDLLVFNNTKVIKARLFGKKSTGGAIEVLIERLLSDKEALVQIRASKSPKAGSSLFLEDSFPVLVKDRQDAFFILEFPDDVLALLERYGKMPLPPYIERLTQDFDESRYQTVYAKVPGAVAAPTAGLHFDENLLAQIKAKGIQTTSVTLHVGAGTFQPVRVENLSEHKMHQERYQITQEAATLINETKKKGGRIVCVGTTSLRALESAASFGKVVAGNKETSLFIVPGYTFQIADVLITNFHLPKSTLLMLVSAFAGFETIQSAYRHAITEKYRFFSYGDAMILNRIPLD